MYITYTLAQIMGLYLFLVGIAMLLHPKNFKIVLTDVEQSKTLFVYSGLISTILGLIIIRIHNIWVPNWPVVVTLIGWFIFIKGLYRLFFLEKVITYNKKLSTKKGYQWFCWISIILGAYLIIMGFFG